MSAIASFIRIPITAVEHLRSDYGECLETGGESVADYDWSGYVIATLLSYLDEHGIKLMQSSHDELTQQLSQTQEATIFILTAAHKEAYLDRLTPEHFLSDDLRDYFNDFNATDEVEIGQAMLDGIHSIHQSLSALDQDSVVVLTIGRPAAQSGACLVPQFSLFRTPENHLLPNCKMSTVVLAPRDHARLKND
jgi:hypothetical protein